LYQVVDHHRMTDYLDDKTIGRRDENGKLIIAPVTIILATDQPSKLLQAMRKRMEQPVTLLDYTTDELVAIGEAHATKLDLLVSSQALRALAETAQCRPRRILQNLNAVKLYFHGEKRQLSAQDIRTYFRDADIDDQGGLDALQQLYMHKLHRLGRASLQTMAALLNSDAEEVLRNVEAGLAKLEFVVKLSGGRQLTPAGEEWIARHEAKRERAEHRLRQREGGEGA
jgi:Holliday junction resolvasome RuvABC ATP-dependent DNA helicase subunit